MAEKTVTQESFNLLLRWLGSDDMRAAAEYERVRQRLIRLFIGRGCHEAETLADQVIDRVAEKAHLLDDNSGRDPTAYFFGVAHYVYLEWLRGQKRVHPGELPDLAAREQEADPNLQCLESCLAGLSKENREFILQYYNGSRQAKIDNRKRMARSRGLTLVTLRVRANRIRTNLQACVRRCLSE